MVKDEKIGIGRRKKAVAAIRLRRGSGKINVNGKSLKEYFQTNMQQQVALSPLHQLDSVEKYDLIIRIKGGGLEAQAEAVRLGLARVLVLDDEERRGKLKGLGYLTRDPRKKERKKYGLAGARKSFQFSKR